MDNQDGKQRPAGSHVGFCDLVSTLPMAETSPSTSSDISATRDSSVNWIVVRALATSISFR